MSMVESSQESDDVLDNQVLALTSVLQSIEEEKQELDDEDDEDDVDEDDDDWSIESDSYWWREQKSDEVSPRILDIRRKTSSENELKQERKHRELLQPLISRMHALRMRAEYIGYQAH